MSSRGSAELVRPLTRAELERLAASLPYQRIRDTPLHPYYTNWKAFEGAQTLPWAPEPVEPELPRAKASLRLDPQGLHVDAAQRGLEVARISPEDVREWGMPVDGKLDAVHALRWGVGARLVFTETPEEAVVLEALGGRGYSGYHIEAQVAPGVSGRLVFITYTPREGITTITLKAELSPGAGLELSTVNLGGGAVYVRRLVIVEDEASYTSRIASLGGVMVHDREDVYLIGRRAKAEVKASLSSVEGEKLDSIQNIIARGPEAEGSASARGIVNGRGYLVSRGLGRVEATGRGSKISYESYVIVMDDGGKGYSVPMLEVDTGDILDARHSTAVLAPPEEEVFYLRQRGLSPREVRYLLTLSTLEYSGALEASGIKAAQLAEHLIKSVSG